MSEVRVSKIVDKTTEKFYRLKYDIPHTKGSFTYRDLGGCGATDALIVVSVLRDNDTGDPFEGTKSFGTITIDGREGVARVPDVEIFQASAALINSLQNSAELSENLQALCCEISTKVREFVTGNAPKEKA